jgi:hypothetical protein
MRVHLPAHHAEAEGWHDYVLLRRNVDYSSLELFTDTRSPIAVTLVCGYRSAALEISMNTSTTSHFLASDVGYTTVGHCEDGCLIF